MPEIKKIIFIETEPPDFHVFTKTPIPRLGTILLSTILNNNGYNATTYVETIHAVDLKDLLSADAVGLSSITSTAPRSYEIADILRKAGVPVFLGGPHVTYMIDEALEHCDYVLRGEADDTIVPFIKALEKGDGFKDIPGLSFRKDGKVHHNKVTAVCKDMDALPAPDFSIVKGLETKGARKLTITPVMTSRGCPYDCSFCSVTKMFGHQYRFRSKEKVLGELQTHLDEGIGWIFFYDDNFTANRKRSKELMREMIARKLTPKWTAQVRVEIAKDPELLQLMKDSGCHTVYIGFESVNPETLKIYNKKQSVEDIENCIKILHEYKIRIHGMFVFGSDEDTVDTIHETVRFARKNDIESVQFLMLTPLPGTNLYYDFIKNDRIVNNDWSMYDAHHAVFQPKKMTCYELQTETMKATKDFYNLWQVIRYATRFDYFGTFIKAYGWSLTKSWIKKSDSFVEYTRKVTNAGRAIEITARKTAEDLWDKYNQLELSSTNSTSTLKHAKR